MTRHIPAAFLVATTAAAAQPASLTGTWTYQPRVTPRTLPAAPSAVLGSRFSLAIEGSSVVVQRSVRGHTIATRLSRDGSRTITGTPGRLCEGDAQIHETASFASDTLVFTLIGQAAAGTREVRPVNIRRLLHLEGPDRLVVEATISQNGQTRQVGSVYARTNDTLPAPQPHMRGAASASIGKLSWLGTMWKGTEGAVTTEERWTPVASGAMMAVARTLRDSTLVSFEFLCIAERQGSLVYAALPDGATSPTFFTLTSITDTSATFENPAHDFPKQIRYIRSIDGSTLWTEIAGENGARPRRVTLTRTP